MRSASVLSPIHESSGASSTPICNLGMKGVPGLLVWTVVILCSAEIFLCCFTAEVWALSCKQQVLFCSAAYTFCDGHWVKLLITKPLSGHLGRELDCLRPLVFLRKWKALFCYPQKEKMKIKTQQLVEKVRRSPNDNGSFEVQGKLKK